MSASFFRHSPVCENRSVFSIGLAFAAPILKTNFHDPGAANRIQEVNQPLVAGGQAYYSRKAYLLAWANAGSQDRRAR